MTEATGRIIKVSRDGWGFISSRDIEFTRIFFHWTALKQDTLRFLELKTGMMVKFVPLEIPGKGYRAVHVSVIERPKNETSTEGEVSSLQEPRPEHVGTTE